MQDTIYTGVWTNHAYGRVNGLTLTLSNRNGAVLIAFLAIVVQVLGGYFWAITSRIVFVLRSKHSGHGLYHQQQAILRNTTSSASATWQFLRTGLTWRQSSSSVSIIHAIALAAVAATIGAGFTIAAIFSSWASQASSEVLLTPTLCGGFEFFGVQGYTKNVTPLTTEQFDHIYTMSNGYGTDLALIAMSHARTCSDSKSTRIQSCRPLVRKKPTFTSTMKTECPFGLDICDGMTLELDSGPIDSLLDMGINSKPDKRITSRIVTQCSPLKTAGYRSDWINSTDPLIASLNFTRPLHPDSRNLVFNYGPSVMVPTLLEGDYGETVNFTFLYNDHSINGGNYSNLGGFQEAPSFLLSSESWWKAYPDGDVEFNTFLPVPELRSTDGDVELHFLSSGAHFTGAVHDPWFRSEQETSVGLYDARFATRATMFASAYPVNVIACAEQIQRCIYETQNCDTLGPSIGGGILGGEGSFGRYNSMFKRLASTRLTSLFNVYGGAALLAQSHCIGGICAPLPDDQWTLEFKNVFKARLISMQRMSLDMVTGPSNPIYAPFWAPPTAEDSWMCENQIVVHDDYTSFSMLAIILILGLGFIIVGLDLFLEFTLPQGQRPRAKEWQALSMLQLHRVVLSRHEETMGRSPVSWAWVDKDCPVAERQASFGRVFNAEATHNQQRTMATQTEQWTITGGEEERGRDADTISVKSA